jgi:hypothetical protein
MNPSESGLYYFEERKLEGGRRVVHDHQLGIFVIGLIHF